GSRRYLASLPISPVDAPGVLRVVSGDTIQAVYSDADDGSGLAAQVTARAVIDCEPPRISDVSISDATESSAQVSWRTDSATTGTVEVGTTCGAVAQSVESGFPAMEHRVRILGLEPGTLYYARIRAADAAGNSTVDDAAGACFPFRTSVAFCTFEDDLEPKPQDGWRFDPSIWSAATTPLAHSRTHAWSLRTSPGPMNATLVLPALRPETSTRLEFWHNLETPEGESGGVLEVSRDGGATWSDLGNKITDGGGYTGPILVDLEGQELVEGWTGGVAGPLTRVSLSLDDFAGERILVRFRFISSGLLELPKRWLIDDVRVCGLSGETGRIGFSRPAYPCEASVIVTVSDASLTGRGSVDVDVTSTHQTLPERLTLIERSAGSFRGNIALYDSAVPGLLYAESGDSIRAVYRDERNADGAASTAEAFSKVDCDPPRLDGVQLEGAGGRAVRVSWRADEPVEGSLAFGDSCGRTSRILPASPFGTRPSALLTNLDTNEQVFFKVSAVDDAGNSAVEDAGGRCYTFQIDSTCGFRDTLEPPAAGWTHAAAQGQDRWSVAVLGAAHSPTHAWFGPDSAQPLDAWLVTPPFDVEGSSELQFWHTFALESGLDGAVLEISTDGQKSWTDIGGLATEGSYNGFIFGAGDFRQAWTGGDIGAMTRVSVPLGEFVGTGRQVRFRIVCDQGFNVRGWFIDDVAVCTSALGGVAASFARGNCAADAKIDIADAIFLLGHLFLGGREPACSQACDANADGALNLTDAVFLLHHLFIGGAAPEPPERCGAVLSSSVLDCAADACVSR
ncbi:MAG TPA: choice-of-anchor J domain-containing protein, partial [Planctomycetota bacterium]|nr:choice-of-anchor J domain-containing protein [Planctomycetota bacterium]